MKDVNDIFSMNIKKVAEVPGLQFEQSVFESPLGAESTPAEELGEEDVPVAVGAPIALETEEDPVVEKSVPEENVGKEDLPKSFAEIVGGELDDQILSLAEAHNLLTLIHVDHPGIEQIQPIKRLVEDAITNSRFVQKRVNTVQVI
jgi:hypothetical protein